MFTAKNYPDHIAPEELDAYLANGWYRMGQTIFTTHFLCFGDEFYSAIWVRLGLKEYQFSKSLRKLLRQNGRFRHEYRPAIIDEEKETLYQRYRADFPGLLAPSLVDSLRDGEDFNVYQTLEFAVYDNDQLIAVSFFDVGQKSLASILGIYDPAYRPFSLGLYTMVMEVAYGKNNGFDFFYPGYVVPGYSRFDYKLRIGDVDYLDLRAHDWLPFDSLKAEDIPLDKMRQKLLAMQARLREAGLEPKIQYYPLFEANLFGYTHLAFFDYPILLYCGKLHEDDGHYIIVFDPRIHLYQLLFCVNYDDIAIYLHDPFANLFHPDRNFTELIVIDHVIETSAQTAVISQALLDILRNAPSVW
jgi:leucyl-tRNA---protein transferase